MTLEWSLATIRNIDFGFENGEIFICKGGQEVIEEGRKCIT
jgi:hypothetical protein